VVHTRYDHAASEAIRVAVLEFCAGEEVGEGGNGGETFEVVDVDFFDDESMVVVVRAEGKEKGVLFYFILFIFDLLIVIEKVQDRR